MLIPTFFNISTTIPSIPAYLLPFIFLTAPVFSSLTTFLSTLSFSPIPALLLSPPTSLISLPFSSWTKYCLHLTSVSFSQVNSSPIELPTDETLRLFPFLTLSLHPSLFSFPVSLITVLSLSLSLTLPMYLFLPSFKQVLRVFLVCFFCPVCLTGKIKQFRFRREKEYKLTFRSRSLNS